MRHKLLAAVAALPLFVSTSAVAADENRLYSACVYQDRNTGVQPFTQLFILDAFALKDYYGEWTYEKNLAWEKSEKDPNLVRNITGYYPESLVGQFKKFAEEKGDSHATCFATTDRERAFYWYRARLAETQAKYNKVDIQDWRPTKDAFIDIEPWPVQ